MTAQNVSQPASGVKSQLDAEVAEKLHKVVDAALPKAFIDVLKYIEGEDFTLYGIEFEPGAIDLKFIHTGVGFGYDFTLRDMALHAPVSIYCRVSQTEIDNTTQAMVFLIVHLAW